MKLPPFKMHRPTSTEGAVALRAELGDESAFYGGGTELLLIMKMGMTDLEHLVDIKTIDGLSSISFVDGALRIGAAATHREIENHPLVRKHLPALASMIKGIANVRVRAVGTLGGNLAFADPASDPASFLTALDAVVEVRGSNGVLRAIPIAELWIGAYQTALAEEELIEAIIIAPTVAGEVTVHQRMKFTERPAITVTVSTKMSSDKIVSARVAVGAVAPVPVRVPAAEEALRGTRSDSVAVAANTAGEVAAVFVQLLDDTEENLVYKRQLIRVLVGRASAEAMESALSA